jgi:low affinity Fe/Cu permease
VTAQQRVTTHVAGEPRRAASRFPRIARNLTAWTGSAVAATLVVGSAVVWLLVGILTDFPRWWELVVTAGVPFLTLLMVVMLQHTQNHDARATQLKLDELIRANEAATNRMMTVEDASADDLERISEDFRQQATDNRREPSR